jgi:hypothetical protein
MTTAKRTGHTSAAVSQGGGRSLRHPHTQVIEADAPAFLDVTKSW